MSFAAPNAIADDEQDIRNLWARASAWQFPTNLHVSFTMERHAVMTAAELAQAEARIAHLPEHPEHRTLADERRRLEHGPDTQTREIWALDQDHWRSNLTSPDTDSMGDIARTPEYTWAMGQHALKILDPGAAAPPSGDLASAGPEAGAYCRRVLWGGLAAHPGLVIESVTVTGDSANLTTMRDDGMKWVYDLIRVAEVGGWAVVRAELASHPTRPQTAGGFTTFAGWRVDRSIDPPLLVPASIEQRNSEGRLVESYRDIEVRPLDREEFNRVSTIPTFDGIDAVRGALSLKTIHDYRPDAETRSERTAGGVVSAPIAAAELPARPPTGWRVVGWIVAACLAASLVILKLTRRGSPGHA